LRAPNGAVIRNG